MVYPQKLDWRTRVRLVAETDRVLQAQHRKRHDRWTSGQTAVRLRLSPSTVSMCLQLARGLTQWPDLAAWPSLRQAYNQYRMKMRHGARRPQRTPHR